MIIMALLITVGVIYLCQIITVAILLKTDSEALFVTYFENRKQVLFWLIPLPIPALIMIYKSIKQTIKYVKEELY